MHNPKLQIIRKSSFTATPWKNGGGITHEAMRMPPSGDPFRWRVSVAHIDASGPFSDFAAYNRKMVLLRGAGIELRFGGGEPGSGELGGAGGAGGGRRTLRRVGDLVEFDGAVPTYCELLQGPCVDLNLMVSKSDAVAVRVERITEPLAVSASLHETTLVFPIERGMTLETNTGETATLEPWDLAVLSRCSGRLGRLEAGDTGASAVFVATLCNQTSWPEPGIGLRRQPIELE